MVGYKHRSHCLPFSVALPNRKRLELELLAATAVPLHS